jgi:translation initiation factor 2B subunit (eIF-2B alpha/beta/delta family)
VLAALAAWRADFAQATVAVARQAQAILPASGWISTTTRSSLVESTLLLARAEGRALHVLLGESRPMSEGKGLAASLSAAGIATWFAVDGALPLLLPQAGVFLVGADAVRGKSFLTKAGTYALLLVARELSVPAYVLSQRAKFVSDRCTRLALPRRDPAEVWPDAPAGVLVVNTPFEEAPLGLVRGVITESGFRFKAVGMTEAQAEARKFWETLRTLPDRVRAIENFELNIEALQDANVAGAAVSAVDAGTWQVPSSADAQAHD